MGNKTLAERGLPSKLDTRPFRVPLHCGHQLIFNNTVSPPKKDEWVWCFPCGKSAYVLATDYVYQVRCKDLGCQWPNHERNVVKNTAFTMSWIHYEETGHETEYQSQAKVTDNTDVDGDGEWSTFDPHGTQWRQKVARQRGRGGGRGKTGPSEESPSQSEAAWDFGSSSE